MRPILTRLRQSALRLTRYRRDEAPRHTAQDPERRREMLNNVAGDAWDAMVLQAEKIRDGEVESVLTREERIRFHYLVSEIRKTTWEAWQVYGHLQEEGQAHGLTTDVLLKLPKEDKERVAAILEREALLRNEFTNLSHRAQNRRDGREDA